MLKMRKLVRRMLRIRVFAKSLEGGSLFAEMEQSSRASLYRLFAETGHEESGLLPL